MSIITLPQTKDHKIVVAGAGGFIGGHLVRHLIVQGYTDIIAVDVKPKKEWHQYFNTITNFQMDLKLLPNCEMILEGAHTVYNLAADMGGMGFIENNKALCMMSVLINTHLLAAAHKHNVQRYFYASSACVYNADRQRDPNVTALKESDAYPAMPEDGYGWEKLFSERMCRHYREDFGLETRITRFHNVYGPYGTYDGGREKAPAAICRKIIEAKKLGKHEIEIWGDGNQTRSFMYISDCIKGIELITHSDFVDPINLGSNELVSINQLVSLVENIACINVHRKYNLSAPKGVNGRNSDNTLIYNEFNWQPSTALKDGLKLTYDWILNEMEKNHK